MSRRSVAACVLALALTASAASAREADPFYLGLLREGIAELQRGESSDAAQSLQIACFGLLEEPKLLAEGLTHLGLAQAKLNDGKAFRATFDRLASIEARFHAYSEAALDAPTRAAFAEQAAALVPPAELAATPVFAEIAEARVRREIQKLPPRQRRKEIERRLKAAPGDPLLLALLAELDPAAKRAAAARPAEAAPAPSKIATEPAAGPVADPPPPVVTPPAPPANPTPPLPSVPATAATPSPATRPRAAAPPPASLSDADAARLAEARDLAAKARVSAELDQASKLARQVADANPGSAEAQLLAGEIAYRGSQFSEAVHYLGAAGDAIQRKPTLLFYLAVAQYETGDLVAAKRSLEGSLHRIQRTPFVERYAQKITGAPASP
jgi:tetratricopeptide (TPR) repeat protein